MKRAACYSGLLLFFIFSCKKESSDLNESNLIITTGSYCGWCAGNDSLSITAKKTFYEFVNPCDKKTYTKDTLTIKSDWENLVAKLDWNEFQKTEVNSCNVCVDGCDIWVAIINSESHKIRYGYSDSAAIQKMKPFLLKLDSIRTHFRKIISHQLIEEKNTKSIR